MSNTFGSALWATGYIGQAMAAGAVGLNLHGHPLSCSGYSPLCLPDPAARPPGQLRAQPDWYALLLARHAGRLPAAADDDLGGGRAEPRRRGLLRARPHAQAAALRRRRARLAAAGAADRRRRRARRGAGAAADRRLAVRRPTACGIGGREVGADGSWREPAGEERARCSGGDPRRWRWRRPRRRSSRSCRQAANVRQKASTTRGGTACPRSGAARPTPPRR